jgi:hypothetical protein
MRLRLAGWSCQQVAHALLLDDDTVRGWRKLFEQRGIEGIASFDGGGNASYLTAKQEDDLKAWAGAALPRSTRQTGAWTLKEFGLVYENRSGPVALLSAPSGSRRSQAGRHSAQPRIKSGGDEDQQKPFIESYDKLLNSLPDNEAVLFAGAVRPTHPELVEGRDGAFGASLQSPASIAFAWRTAPLAMEPRASFRSCFETRAPQHGGRGGCDGPKAAVNIAPRASFRGGRFRPA